MLEKTSTGTLISVANYAQGVENTLGIKSAAVLEAIDPNYVYSVVHGVQGDVFNENHDRWSWDDELIRKRADGLYTYETWKGKPNCVGHVNKNPATDWFGSVLDCYPIHDKKTIDMVIRTDRRIPNSPAPGIEAGIINKVSMGCIVKYSNCTYCSNRSETVSDYCEHVRYMKGKEMPVPHDMHYLEGAVVDRGPMGRLVKIGEDCHDSTGVEMSWVVNPAFPACNAYDILNPRPVDQFKALGSALRWSINGYHKKAGRIITKACSKGYLESDEYDAIAELIKALRLED